MLAVGSPGGATIITTVLQVLVNRLDLGMDLPAGGRRAARLAAQLPHRPGRARRSRGPDLQALGHTFVDTPELGAATGIEFLSDGRLQAVAEPVRRGGGSAGVVHG